MQKNFLKFIIRLSHIFENQTKLSWAQSLKEIRFKTEINQDSFWIDNRKHVVFFYLIFHIFSGIWKKKQQEQEEEKTVMIYKMLVMIIINNFKS